MDNTKLITNTNVPAASSSNSSSGGLPTATIISITALAVSFTFALLGFLYNVNKLRFDAWLGKGIKRKEAKKKRKQEIKNRGLMEEVA
jgi:hypothetical protein